MPANSAATSDETPLSFSQLSVDLDNMSPSQLSSLPATPPASPPPQNFDGDALYTGYITKPRQELPPDPPPFNTSNQWPRGPAQPTIHTPTPTHTSQTTPLSPTMSVPSSFPECHSPPPSSLDLPGTPTSSTPSTYVSQSPSQVTTFQRDFALDYDRCMIALGDVNRLARVLYRGGPTSDPAQDHIHTTCEDVVEVMMELKIMLDRIINKHPQLFR